METGVSYNKQKLHQKQYFGQLVRESTEMPAHLKPLLKIGRETVERVMKTEKALVRSLVKDSQLLLRVERLMSIPGIGAITALSWALEIGEVSRFTSLKHAVSYCGLCSAEKSSAGVQKRSPISKQRNKHLQTVLIEAAKLAPRWNSDLALLHDKELQRGNRNRATLAVARKMVAYLLAVDRREKPFQGGEKQARPDPLRTECVRLLSAACQASPKLGTGRTGAIPRGSPRAVSRLAGKPKLNLR
jgi:hypothetical protein